MNKSGNIILIGGSAGSFPIIMDILPLLPKQFKTPIVIVLHRLKNVVSEMDQLFTRVANNKIIKEPEDKEPIQSGMIYLAPQNYHLLIEPEGIFSLDYSEPINYSRPSIDLSFASAAIAFKKQCLGVLLSGANQDGTKGISKILQQGGKAIIQDPEEAAYRTMPEAAAQFNPDALIVSTNTLIQIIRHTLEQV